MWTKPKEGTEKAWWDYFLMHDILCGFASQQLQVLLMNDQKGRV